MNKAIIYAGLGLGTAALAYLGYKYMQTPSQTYSTTSLNPNSGVQNFTTDPQQSYPFVANTPPRVDNSNQPWANNNRGAIAQVSAPQVDVNLSNVNMIANYTKALAGISESASSIWDTFGMQDWFSSGDPGATVADVDFSDWGMEETVDGSFFDWSA